MNKVLGLHVQRVHRHKKIAYTDFHTQVQIYLE